jgi:hypothetical protein
MAKAIFLRVLEPKPEEKGTALAAAVQSAREGHLDGRSTFTVDPSSFRQVPGAPFAYWVSDNLRRKFEELPPFESEGRTVKQGLATADDFRFVRAWWEVDPRRILHVPVKAEELDDPGRLREYQEACREQTRHGKRWVPFAKGGAYSPYYADVYLVVDWENDGERIRNFERAYIRNEQYYFRPGLTWSDRTTRLFGARAWPAGGIFSVKGSAGFFPDQEALALGLMNARLFNGFLSLLVGAGDAAARSYQVGTIGRVPFIGRQGPLQVVNVVAASAASALSELRKLDEVNESGHGFVFPAAVRSGASDLGHSGHAWLAEMQNVVARVHEAQAQVDDATQKLYAVNTFDLQSVNFALDRPSTGVELGVDTSKDEADPDIDDDETDGTIELAQEPNWRALVSDLISYGMGCSYGRWDIRIVRDPTLAPTLPSPFDPLPRCSPAMLVGPDGLPARSGGIVSEPWLRARPVLGTLPPASVQPATVPDEAYPLRISWSGILVDDEDHPDDIVGRSREALATLFGEQSHAMESEAVQLLGFKDLREYFRNPRGFWADHLRRYSKKPRKAPIYWLLQSKKRDYAVWLYYPRLDGDMLFKVLQFFVEPKIRREEQRLADLHARIGQSEGARARRQAERAVEQQEAILADVREFRDRLARVADLHLVPNLDDGVVLNAAPLHELMPWPEPARYWRELLQGKYDWSDIARQIRERRGQGMKFV